MQDNEVPNVFPLNGGLTIVFVDVGRFKIQAGKSFSKRVMPCCTRCKLVDSRGSRKPLARSRATTFWHQGWRTRIRSGRSDGLAGYSEGAVAREPVTPILEVYAKRLANQQRTKTRTIDKQVGGHSLASSQLHRKDVAPLGILVDLINPSVYTLDAALLTVMSQHFSVSARVDMVSLGQAGIMSVWKGWVMVCSDC